MTTDHIELIWDRGCTGTAQTASGRRLDIGGNDTWSAEQLLMAAAESAVMTSFLGLAEEQALDVLGYMSSAGAVAADAKAPTLRIVVRPCVVVARPADVARAQALLAHTLDHSPVARALAGALRLDPQVVAIDPPRP